jgi:hypothetical protein
MVYNLNRAEADSMARLQQKADRLNAELESIDDAINAVEKKIAATNVGLTAWVDLQKDLETRRDEDESCRYYKTLQLGWTEIDGMWCLAVRTMLERHDEDGEWLDAEVVSQPSPLAGAPRVVRIRAAEQLHALVERLEYEAETAYDAIRKAKKLIE